MRSSPPADSADGATAPIETMNAPRKPTVHAVKRRIYDRLVNKPMVTGHWTVRHAPEERRAGPCTVDSDDDTANA